jgi:hypothetical protein
MRSLTCLALPLEELMHREAFAHFLPILIIIVVATTGVIVVAVRLFFRRGMDALDI